MTKRAIVACSLLLVTGLAGCGSSPPPETAAPSAAPTADDPDKGRVTLGPPFRNPADGYQIEPPAGWVQRRTNPADGISVAFTAPTPDTSGGQPFNTNLNVFITPAKGTLEQSVAQTIQMYPSVLENYQVVINEPTVMFDEHPAHFLGGTYDVPGVGKVQNLQLMLVEAGKLYTTTFTTPEKSYPALQTNAFGSLISFTLTSGS
jgi:hypothetical protein